MKFLLALDFDHTIIDEDSDNAVLSLNPSLLEQAKTRSKGIVWCDLMNELVQVLQIEHTPAQITERLAEVPIETQMYTSLEYAYEAGTEIIIISDSNTFYIDQIMEKKDFKRFIRRVITNNGVIGENGKLSITRHTLDNDCVNLCSKNLCKGLFGLIQDRSYGSMLRNTGRMIALFMLGMAAMTTVQECNFVRAMY